MTYSEILNSNNGKKQNVIYKFENLTNGKIYIGQTKKNLGKDSHNIFGNLKINQIIFIRL